MNQKTGEIVKAVVDAASSASEPAGALVGNRKLGAAATVVGVAILNAIGAHLAVPAPANPDLYSVILYGLQLLGAYGPTFGTYFAAKTYTVNNVKQDIAHTEAQAQVASAAVSPVDPRPSGAQIPQMEAARAQDMTVTTAPLIKPRISWARQIYSTWAGAKALFLGNFKDRFEVELVRLAKLNPTMGTVEAIRTIILNITGCKLDDAACTAMGQIPGFLGAIGANADIKIIGDLITAIDNTPSLEYLKKSLTVIAERYAVKDILDDVSRRMQLAKGGKEGNTILMEFGFPQWQVDRTDWSGSFPMVWYSTMNIQGTYEYVPFDACRFAGVDERTYADLAA